MRYQAALHPVSTLSYAAGFLSYERIDWQAFWRVWEKITSLIICLLISLGKGTRHPHLAVGCRILYHSKDVSVCPLNYLPVSAVSVENSWPQAGHLTFTLSPPPFVAHADSEATIKIAERSNTSFFMMISLIFEVVEVKLAFKQANHHMFYKHLS